jgi:hypothetical protein
MARKPTDDKPAPDASTDVVTQRPDHLGSFFKTVIDRQTGGVYRARAGDHRAPTDYVQFKLRIRAPLVKRLQREADKKKQSANNEAVQRLEESFDRDESSRRDSQILEMMLGFFAKNKDMMQLLNHLLSELRGLDEDKMIETTKRVIDLIESQKKTSNPEGDSE